jgi:Ca2+/Na+ antiporter
MRRIPFIVGLALLGFVMLATAIWGVLALFFSGPHSDAVRYSLAAAVAVASLAALIALFFRRWRWRAFAAYLALFAALLVWYFSIEPSNERDWQTDVAVLPYATVEGDMVTVHNIRNFEYRTETDYTPAYYDKRFDLNKLEGVDLIAVYWMGPAIAHVFLSFAFEGGDHLAVSIETRKEKGEAYSTVKGFFRQYELYYVVADERDVIRLRTNYRHDPPEEVYVYRAAGTNGAGRRLFMEYISRINAIKATPEWYNSLTTNCTTNIWKISRVNPQHLPLSWKILASGYVPEYLYEHGRLVTGGLTFPELQSRVHVNDRAHAADTAEDFSRRIRE